MKTSSSGKRETNTSAYHLLLSIYWCIRIITMPVWTRLPIYMSVTFSVYKLMIRCFLQPLMNHVHNKTPLPQKATRRRVCINEPPPPAKPIQIDQWLRSGLTRHTHQLVTAEEGVLRGQWFSWKSMVRWANKNGLSDSCRYCLLD